jgi:hypothetical protein
MVPGITERPSWVSSPVTSATLSTYGAAAGAIGLPMPAEATQRSNQETWQDWVPSATVEPALLLTREQFLDRLRGRGIDANERDLRFWEYEGILPRPVRLREPGARATRPYYPLWMMAAVFTLRELQREGRQLRDIAPLLRRAATNAAAELDELMPGIREEDLSEEDVPEGTTLDDVADVSVLIEAMETITRSVFFEEVVPALLRLDRLHERYGTAVRPEETKPTYSIAVVFTDVTGKEHRSFFRVPNEEGGFRQRQSPPADSSDSKS